MFAQARALTTDMTDRSWFQVVDLTFTAAVFPR
jgi:hypothetical protein